MMPTQGRPLGQIETSMALLHELNGSTQTCSLLSFSGPLSATQLQHAARALHRRHPLLRSRIVEHEQALHFQADVPFTAIDLRCAPVLAEQSVAALLQQQLEQVLDPQRALWSLLLLSTPAADQHQLLLSCHHAIADAVSMQLLLGELLSNAERLLTNAALDDTEVPLAAALEDHLLDGEQHPSPSATLAAIAYQANLPVSQRRTGIRRLLLDRRLTTRLQQHAREQGLSLNSLLAAALLKAAAESEFGAQICINTAVSLRQRANRPITNMVLGCYIGVASHCLTVTGRSLPSVALDYQHQLRASLPHQAHRSVLSSLASNRTRIGALPEQQGFTQGIALTNHGACVFPVYRHFQLLDYANVASRVAGNFAVALHVTGFAGALSLCCTFPMPLMDPARIERLQLRLQLILLDFCATTVSQ